MKKYALIFSAVLASFLLLGCTTTEKTSENAKTEQKQDADGVIETTKSKKSAEPVDHRPLSEDDIGMELTIFGNLSITDLGPVVRENVNTAMEVWFYLKEDESAKEVFESIKTAKRNVTVRGILSGVESKFKKELTVLSIEQ